MRTRRLVSLRSVMSAPILITLLAVVGCGSGRPERVTVAGRILVDGTPLSLPEGAVAFVQFVPSGSRAASGEIDPEGCFVLTTFGDEGEGDGCIPGAHRIAITAYESLGPDARRWLLPKKYSNRRTSGLEISITEPTDELEFQLTWNGGKPYVERFGGIEERDALDL